MIQLPTIYPLSDILEPMKPCLLSDKNPRHFIKLQQIMLDPNYIAEEKIDGCHYMTIDNRFFSTHISVKTGAPVEKTDRVLHLAEALQKLNMPKLILDGEISIPGKKSENVVSIIGGEGGRAMYLQQSTNQWLQFKLFDILRDEDGQWLQDKPWLQRRKKLEQIYQQLQKVSNDFCLNRIIVENKEQYLQEVFNNGGEGIVLKYIHGTYVEGKRPMWNWIKVKAEVEDDVVIIGFEDPEKIYTGQDIENCPYWEGDIPVTKFYARGWIGAIIFGKYRNGELIKLGTCSGMTDAEREMFSKNPETYVGRVIVIKAMEKTKDGYYRHPRFVRLHSDKNAKECIE